MPELARLSVILLLFGSTHIELHVISFFIKGVQILKFTSNIKGVGRNLSRGVVLNGIFALISSIILYIGHFF